MERAITAKLAAWSDANNRKPLIIRGARQVGKTYSVLEFARRHISGVCHHVNLERHPEWHSIFDYNLDPMRILSELELLMGTRITPGKDLLFLDEIQACPNAISALRYFYEEMPLLHIIAAGSLLEFALKDIAFPVGRVELLQMHPMTFAEFLNGTGNEVRANVLLEPPRALPQSLHQSLLHDLRTYFLVGGLPECVATWASERSLQQVSKVQNDLIATFRQDFMKYTPRVDPDCLNDVLSSLSQSVGRQIKYARLSQHFSQPTIKKAVRLLRTARLLHRVRSTSLSGLPLEALAKQKIFKIIFADIGLFLRLNGMSAEVAAHQGKLVDVLTGAMAEQFVGQEILAAGHDNLFYWSRQAKSSTAEVDYVIKPSNEILPIEVKGAPTGRLRSLHLLLKEHPSIRRGIVLSDAPYGTLDQQRITFVPLYFAHSVAKVES